MNSVYLDKVTEAIAHFIGLFDTTIEEARQKQAYDEFKASQAKDAQPSDHDGVAVKVDARHDLEDFDPHVPYLGLPPELVVTTVWSNVWFTPPEIPAPHGPDIFYPGFNVPHVPFASSGIVLPAIVPPGSLPIIVSQDIRLSDADYVGAGGSGLKFTPAPADDVQMNMLQTAAADLSPIDDLALPGTPEDIGTLVTTAVARLDGFTADGHGDAEVVVVKDGVIEGTFVNGVEVQDGDAPQLEDYADFLKDEEDGGPDKLDFSASPNSSDFMAGWGDGSIAPSVELESGGNTVVNSAVITNDWASSGVIAAVGDHVELNAVIQINIVSDTDSVGASLNGWRVGPDNIDETFNIAAFQRIDPEAEAANAGHAPAGFPSYYVVTEISGDLIMLNWIDQYAFMMDGDVCILSSSGVKTVVSTGDNTAVNDVSLGELGYYYDLIIVGGNIYDANIIQQLNLLIDNDHLGAVSGFETTGGGALSTAGNLLWNEAAIVNIGQGNDDENLPGFYKKAADNLAAGKDDLPNQVLHDSAFAGIGVLRVLYISGDIYNLQFIKQTTVLGDSDQVAVAMNELAAQPDAQWTVTTGSNELVNFAGIVDVDGTTKTYVGGESYSDEVLIQAELVSSDPNLGAQDPDVLVNEAVAFLDDGTEDTGPDPHADHAVPLPADSGTVDVMQNMLA